MSFKIAQVQTNDRLLNQMQQNIISPIEAQFQELTGQFIMTLTGCTTIPAGICYWQRATADGPITLMVASGLSGTSNTTAATLTGLPAPLWPNRLQTVLVTLTDNGTPSLGVMKIATTGIISLYVGAAASAFTASGVKEAAQQTVTYMVT